MIWHWPQIIMAAWLAVEILGKPILCACKGEGGFDVAAGTVATMAVQGVMATLLYFGGFWTGATQ